MKLFLAILIGKIINLLTKALKIGGGSAAPGYYSLKLQPDLVPLLITQIPKNIIITGTNGKTTTSRLISQILKSQGIMVIRNSTGSNLERGIASTLITNVSLIPSQLSLSKFDIGIWEVDEAAINKILPIIKPQMVVFLNVFRDQLDRYGEVDNVVNKWSETLKNLDFETTLILNDDDLNIRKLEADFSGPVLKFGLRDQKISGEISNTKSTNKNHLDLEAFDITSRGLGGTSFSLQTKDQSINVNLNLPGIYHIYDFLAAYSVLTKIGVNSTQILKSLEDFTPAFGRVEKISIPISPKNSKEGFIMLIKNPTGATEVLKTISTELKTDDRLLLALNDNFADGTDVSWIWDTEFERLLKTNDQRLTTFISGKRAFDLALRLKYAGFETQNIKVEPDLKSAFIQSKTKLKGRLFILPTYTALLELQRILADLKIKKPYWKEN